MRRSRRPRLVAAVLVGFLLVSGCADDPVDGQAGVDEEARRAADCASAVDTLLAVTQRYLDGIEGTTANAGTSGETGAQDPTSDPRDPEAAEEQFTQALSNIRGYAADLGCDPQEFQADLGAGLSDLTSGGPVARAVLLQLQADTGTTADEQGPLGPDDDLAAAVAAAESGATLQLAAGTFALPDTLVLLRGVTLQGAGRDATVLQADASGGAVLVLTGEPVSFTDLTLARAGEQPGPVISAAPTATLALTGARVTGARADAEGLGGVGVLMAAGTGGQTGPTRRTSLTVTDTELVDNAVAGVVVAGDHRAELVRTVVERSGQCGVCYLDTSDGAVVDSRFVGNAAGLVAGGQARPGVRTTTFEGGEVGIQVVDRAAPDVEGSTVTGAARAAMIWTDTTGGRADGNRCADVEFGIVVGSSATPLLGENDCSIARGE